MSVREVRKRAKPADGREMPVSSKQTLIKRILGNKGIYWPTSDEDDILVNHDDALVEFGRSNAPQWSIRRESIYKMGGDLRPATNDVIRNRRIDLFAHNDNEGDDRRVAILVVGPYSVREYYSRRHVDWVLIAVAATHFYANVALFFSDDADIAPFQRWLRIQDPRAELKISLVRETDAGFRIVARSEARNRGVADNAEGSKEGANNEEHGEEAQESMPEEDVVAVISLEEGIGEPKPEMPED
jgi:hypothetical protein